MIDYYADARDIAQSLDRQGLSSEAQSLRDAIDAGSTASEILMALRWHLERIDSGPLRMDLITRTQIHQLIAAIRSALGGD
jgi:hypothetical protein